MDWPVTELAVLLQPAPERGLQPGPSGCYPVYLQLLFSRGVMTTAPVLRSVE